MNQPLCSLTAVELAAGYRERRFSVEEVIDSVLHRIRTVEPHLNAFCLVDEPRARRQAAESARRFSTGTPIGPLDGIPLSIKDIVLTAEWPTRRGSAALPPAGPSGTDAPSAAFLRAAGAIAIGKTTTPELGWKGVTDSPPTGITRNPWDLNKTPGGSSGGAAAAVASGMGPLALGTDGGGSVRIPASFTGTVGIKASRGLVPLWPASGFGVLSHVGPIARSVSDAVLMLSAIGRNDTRDTSFPRSCYPEIKDHVAQLAGTNLRVGYCLDHPDMGTDPEVREAVQASIVVLKDSGAATVPVKLPAEGLLEAFETLWFVGAASSLAAGVDVAKLDPGLAEIASEGARRTGVAYHRAVLRGEELKRDMDLLFGDIDFLVTPTVPILPFEAGVEVPAPWSGSRWTSWTPFTYPFNITAQPAVSVPATVSRDGLPIGLQIVGRFGDDLRLLQFAKMFESGRGALPKSPSPFVV